MATSSDSTTFRLLLFGIPRLEDATGETPPGLGKGKPLALLAYLATRGEVRREEVVDLLWRDVEEGKARNAFRQALHRLRVAIGDALIPMDRERLWLERDPSRLLVDLIQFEAAIASNRVEEAVGLYRGEFLDGLDIGEAGFDQWLEQERARLRSLLQNALERAATASMHAGRWSDAIAESRRLLSVAPYSPEAAELAATTLLAAGRRSEAQDVVRQFAKRLDDELGLPLPTALRSLTNRLQTADESATSDRAPAQATKPNHADEPAWVGRQAELGQLIATWRSIGADNGATLLIEGPAGIGKTRLVTEFTNSARPLVPGLFLHARAFAATSTIPYAGIADALRGATRARGVAGASKHQLAEAARLLPELRDTFDLPEPASIEDETARIRFFEGVASLLDALAYEQPVCLILEDAEHASSATVALLSYLSTRLQGSACLLILTVRREGLAGAGGGPLRRMLDGDDGRVRVMRLDPLSHEDARTIASASLASLGADTRSAELIAGAANGNPQRAVDLARRVADGLPVSSAPVALRDVLHARLISCTSAQRRLFLVAALIGRPVPLDLLAEAAHLPDVAAFDAVQMLENRGLLRQSDSGYAPTIAAHAELALDDAGPAARSFLAGWIAEALGQHSAASSAELARLYALAGHAEAAFGHARTAAFDALALGATGEATHFLGVARTFAPTQEAQREIESLLDALSVGRLRIAAGDRAAAAPTRDESEGASSSPDAPRNAHVAGHAPSTAIGALERAFPNWRVLLAAALGVVIFAIALRSRNRSLRSFRTLADTLVIGQRDVSGREVTRSVYGSLDALRMGVAENRTPSNPAWADSVQLPWLNAAAAPDGRHVALERMTPAGTDVYVLSADRRDTTRVAAADGDDVIFGWSPDGASLLVGEQRPRANGQYDVDLYAFDVNHGGRTPVDTSTRVVVEASWSPDGSHVGWTARVPPDGQQEVFVSSSDGSGNRNLSRNPRDDEHIAWSADGLLLAFTSWRDGNAELYAYDLTTDRLWRLTDDPAQDDQAIFSPDSRFVAFESTRGGDVGVYVMPALGGNATRLNAGSSARAIRWRGAAPGYVDALRIENQRIGDTTMLSLRVFDQHGAPTTVTSASWSLRGIGTRAVVEPIATADTITERRFVARGSGMLQVVAAVGRWRAETSFVRIGADSVRLVDDDFGRGSQAWVLLGSPRPTSVSGGLSLDADREWESGILSRDAAPLIPGLWLTVDLNVRTDSAPGGSGGFGVSLVAPEPTVTLDSVAPQFLRFASASWSPDARRMIYSVDREIFSEPTPAPTGDVRLKLVVFADSTVGFFLNDSQRWTSKLRIGTLGTRAQLWIAGRSTGRRVLVQSVHLSLSSPQLNR